MSEENQHFHIYIFVALVFAFLLLLHFVLYEAVLQIFQISGGVLAGTLLSLTFLSPLAFIGVSVMAVYADNLLSRLVYRLVMVWMGIFVYLFLASTLYGLIVFISDNSTLNVWGALLFLLAILASIYGVFHGQKIYMKHVTLPSRFGSVIIPEIWKGRKIAWISDVHLGQVRGKKYMSRVAGEIGAIAPDIVFIGGDLYDGVKVDESDIISPLKDLHIPLGIFFVSGNHEEFSDSSHFMNAVRAAEIRVLDGEIVTLDGLQIIGVSDHNAIKRPVFTEILEKLKIDRNRPAILLKHQPSELDIAHAAGVNIQISGHTHRAQMFPLFLIAKLVYGGYDYGLRKFHDMLVYTSSGVGTWGPPLRVLTRNEVVIFTFERD